MSTLTMKFGGSAVGTSASLTQVVSIVLQENERWDYLVVVTAALEGVTDALLEAAQLASLGNSRGYRRIVATVRTRHLAIVDQLPLDSNERSTLQADVDRLLFDLLDVCQSLAAYGNEGLQMELLDTISGVGERLAARIIAAALRQSDLKGVAVDATDLIVSDDTFGNAVPDLEQTSQRVRTYLNPMLERRIIPVITGFIAGTADGRTTTLGRGGSDLSAALLGVATSSDEVWMWTDVDGMMSADPREVESAVVIPELSYSEVAEMAYFGARIIHNRMISPLEAHRIPLKIKNIFKPQQAGTLIHDVPESQKARAIKAVTSINGVGLLSPHSESIAAINETVNRVTHEITGSDADIVCTSRSATCTFVGMIVPTSAGPEAVHNVYAALQAALEDDAKLQHWSVEHISVITVIGSHLDVAFGLKQALFDAVGDVPVIALSQGPSQSSFSFMISIEHTSALLANLHALVLNSDPDNG